MGRSLVEFRFAREGISGFAAKVSRAHPLPPATRAINVAANATSFFLRVLFRDFFFPKSCLEVGGAAYTRVFTVHVQPEFGKLMTLKECCKNR